MPKGQAENDRELAALLTKRAELMESAAKILEETARVTEQIDALERLRRPVKSVNSPDMDLQARAAISDGRIGLKWGEFNDLRRRAGFATLNALAAKVGMKPQALSQAMAPQDSKTFRPIKPLFADRIEQLTGWPASAWPQRNR